MVSSNEFRRRGNPFGQRTWEQFTTRLDGDRKHGRLALTVARFKRPTNGTSSKHDVVEQGDVHAGLNQHANVDLGIYLAVCRTMLDRILCRAQSLLLNAKWTHVTHMHASDRHPQTEYTRLGTILSSGGHSFGWHS